MTWLAGNVPLRFNRVCYFVPSAIPREKIRKIDYRTPPQNAVEKSCNGSVPENLGRRFLIEVAFDAEGPIRGTCWWIRVCRWIA